MSTDGRLARRVFPHLDIFLSRLSSDTRPTEEKHRGPLEPSLVSARVPALFIAARPTALSYWIKLRTRRQIRGELAQSIALVLNYVQKQSFKYAAGVAETRSEQGCGKAADELR